MKSSTEARLILLAGLAVIGASAVWLHHMLWAYDVRPPASICPPVVVQPIGVEPEPPASELAVEWTGAWPVGVGPDTNCVDPGFYGEAGPPPVMLFDRQRELGFREDGTVVWRTKQ